MTTSELVPVLESVLFVAADPVPLERLRSTLGCSDSELSETLEALAEQLRTRGIRLQRGAEGAQLVSAPENAATVEKFLGIQASGKLSGAAMETLAIVGYRQPVSRLQIEEIRGVNSDRALRSLLSQGLIQEVGRAPGVGRPVLYGTTLEFLQRFGLESTAQLPELELASAGQALSSSVADSSK